MALVSRRVWRTWLSATHTEVFMKYSPLLILAASGLVGSVPRPDRESSKPAAIQEPTVITVEANDFALTLPGRVPAGIVTFRLVNHGKELHHAQVIRLEDGKTARDYMKAYTDTGPMPGWVKYLGGPAGTPPGQVHATTTRLTPGHYAVVCRVASPDGVIHLKKGMIREFEVVATKGTGMGSLPVGTDTVTLTDYGFASSRPLTTGHHRIRVHNAGPQPHELVMLTLVPGKTPADFANWGLTGRKGPPPGLPIGGVEFMDQGLDNVFEVDLPPGDYGFICFVPDTKDGKRHYLHGMMSQFALR
jgi:hypothetical protein